MSETEDVRSIIHQDEIQERIKERYRSPSPIKDFGIRRDCLEKGRLSREASMEEKQERITSKEPQEQKEVKPTEREKEEAPKSAWASDTTTTTTTSSSSSSSSSTTGTTTTTTSTTPSTTDDGDNGPPPLEETTVSVETDRRKEESTRVGVRDTTVDGGNAPVGEWNSLPVLVERLRRALEQSLAEGNRRDDGDPPPAVPEDSGIDSEEDLRVRNSMEHRVPLDANYPELKTDLKFLEDLLLSDIQTALSRLRETLDRIDVAALAKHGAASDPSSKLQLLRLVSSLLSRLDIPEEPVASNVSEKVEGRVNLSSKKRRGSGRYTIGVSAEELADARRWLEEAGNVASFVPFGKAIPLTTQEVKSVPFQPSVTNTSEEINDKYTKDAFNQRQSLRDKSKESCESSVFSSQEVSAQVPTEILNVETNMHKTERRPSLDNYQELDINDESPDVNEEDEEKGRVSKLIATLRQRAELAASGGKYNKFVAKKSKIKRANTIDIPSYLKLQAESLGHENAGCVSLRRPINVGDKAVLNAANVTVPSFQPKTENDRKFLALINKNTETPALPPAPNFKTFGYTKATDLSSVTNEHWNSRFSNIKTTFDKPPMPEKGNQSKINTDKQFPGVQRVINRYTAAIKNENTPSYVGAVNNGMNSSGSGFRHAPSSPFRRIEKPPQSTTSPKPTTYPWLKNNTPVPGNTLREKAKMMFDRDNQPKFKEERFENSDKCNNFPRAPWIEHDRNDTKSNNTITENGRLDYRSFCKQFAPFVGKGVPFDTKKPQRQENAAYDKNSGIVDGKISFKMVPEKRGQYPVIETRPVIPEKFHKKDVFEEKESMNNFADATLRGSSSVAVQTGVEDENPDDVRSFRVAPKIAKGSVCTNASVQTTNDLATNAASMSDMEGVKQWKSPCHERRDSNRNLESDYGADNLRSFVLDHNQNYHSVPSGSVPRNDVSQDFRREKLANERSNLLDSENSRMMTGCQLEKNQYEYPVQNSAVSHVTNLPKQERVEDTYKTEESLCPEDVNFLDDEHIENQDISPETGIVTRYTCAIATVASVDSPEPKSEEGVGAATSQTSSSPSPSRSWSRMKSDETTSEEEIRRHNMLQQSLVRKLQNEHVALNEQKGLNQPIAPSTNYYQPVNYKQSTNQGYSQTVNYNQSTNQVYNQPTSYSQPKNQSYNQSHNQSINYSKPANKQNVYYNQTTSNQFVKQSKFLSPEVPKRSEPPPIPKRPEQLAVPKRAEVPSVPIAAASSIPANRVTALRDAYEQAPTNPKVIQKERSPIPNGANPIDSSDEYLVSCANKTSRSIVLSKSESWHQLAMTNHYPKTSLGSENTAATRAACLPKPPKSKSPFKLKSKQYEAASDSVKKMEDKIRMYFDNPSDHETKDSSKGKRSPRNAGKGLVGLSRSRTMPGICDEKLRLTLPTSPQIPTINLNSATDVDKVFDDLFEEATRTDNHHH